MLRYMTDRARPGLVALYNIRPGNGAGPFLQPWSPQGATMTKGMQGQLEIQTRLIDYTSTVTTNALTQVKPNYFLP